MRGEDADIDEALYLLFGMLLNEEETNKFSKKLTLHDELDEKTPYRALRLWIGR
jgi:hypothetical protein